MWLQESSLITNYKFMNKHENRASKENEEQQPSPAIIYARTASAVQDSNQEMVRQIQKCKEYAETHGYAVDTGSIYQEVISGLTEPANRPVFAKILERVDKSKDRIAAIIVADLERLGRGQDIIDTLTRALYEKGVLIESPSLIMGKQPKEKFLRDICNGHSISKSNGESKD